MGTFERNRPEIAVRFVACRLVIACSIWLPALAQQPDAEDHRIWTAPDMPVGLSSKEYFAGEDPVLAAVVELIEVR